MIQCDISVKIDRASFPDDNNIWTFLFLHAFRTGIKGFTIHSYSGLPKTRTNSKTMLAALHTTSIFPRYI